MMGMKRRNPLSAFAFWGLSLLALGLWHCNVGDPEEVYFLNVRVNDSLAVEAGKYDTIEVDLLDADGKVIQNDLYLNPYHHSDSATLAKLPLIAKPPGVFQVRITAHSATTTAAWVLTTNITQGKPEPEVIQYLPLPVTPPETTTTSSEPESISVRMAVPVILAPGGASGEIQWDVLPAGAGQGVQWTSSNPGVAEITPDNKIKPVAIGDVVITGISKLKAEVTTHFDVQVVKAVQVDAIAMEPKALKLYTGGGDGQLKVTLTGSDTGAKYTLSSSNSTVASVSGSGAVQGLKAGSAQITAAVVGFPAMVSVCSVTVITDTPIVAVTPNQTVAYGGEATFKVVVTQDYGTVAEINADMDGDGAFEKTLLGLDSATFTAIYSQAKTFNVAFQVKDSEGNEVDITRTVTVTAPGAPTVKILDPASDITVNTSTYTVKFTVQDPTQAVDEAKDSVVTLEDGANTVKITRTNAGGTGSAQVVITLDKTAPGAPVFVSQPAFTADNTPTWSWEVVAGAAKYQVRLDDSSFAKTTGTIDLAATTYTSASLNDGRHTLYVRSVDDLGNASSPASQAVTVDTKAPDAVAFSGIDGSYTASATPTWTWTPSSANGGVGTYVLKLDSEAEFDWTTTSFVPTVALTDNATHTLTVKEKDQVPGVTGTAKSFSYKVKVNPPGIPVVKSAQTALANNGLTNNPGFTWTSGGGGNGKYRVRLNSETTYRINGVAQTAWSLAAGDADGIYIIRVSEQDDMGRWGAEGTFAITLDRTAPQFANAKIEGKTYALRDGYITNATSLLINYTADGAPKQLSCTLAKNASTACKGAAITDAAGNSATFQITIWSRPDVIFFTTTGTGDGSSWEDAASDIQAVVDQAGSDGKDFWLASGDYTSKNNSLTIWGKTVNMLGGFLLTNYPTGTTGRSKGASILAHISFMGSNGNFDGLQFGGSGLGLGALGTEASPATFVDCIFKGGFEIVLGGSIRFTNCQMTGASTVGIPMSINSGTMIWTGGSITNNTPGSGNYAIEVGSGASATFQGSLTISGNKPAFVDYQIRNAGTLIIATSVTMPCSDVLWEAGGTGSCKGTSYP